MCLVALWWLGYGCSAAVMVRPIAESKRVPPGATVIPVGQATGVSHAMDFTLGGIPDHLYPEIMERAIGDAVKSADGELLIDATLSMRVTQIPLFLVTNLNFWWVRWTAEGTVARFGQTGSAPEKNDVAPIAP